MENEIRVHVVKYPTRPNLVLRYFDKSTGKQVVKSSGTPNLKEAKKLAIIWEAELREGRYAKPSRMTWEAFREHFAANVLPGLAKNTGAAYEASFNALERCCRPAKLSDMTSARMTAFVSQLRKAGKAEASIACYLRHLKAAMGWAHREGLLATLPVFNMPKRVKGAKVMRGRPITGEEFDRMLAAVPLVVENAAAASWEFYLRCLWESGLRLSESLTLRWDDAPGAIVVDLSGRRPMLRIPAEAQKANRDELLPITPEFAALLWSVPEPQRRGRVFKLLARDGSLFRANKTSVSKMVSVFGKKAGIVVDEREKKGKTVRKFASAHDLRRAFGQRWSRKLRPQDLQKLMRHASLSTTFRYYVGDDAEAVSDAIWSGSVLGSGQGQDASKQPKKSTKSR